MSINDDGAATQSRTGRLCTHPVTQAVVAGSLSIIPARKYPPWLRRGIIFAPPLVIGVGVAYLSASPQANQTFRERFGEDESSASANTTTPAERPRLRGIVLGTSISALAVGTVLSGLIAISFWGDEKIERGLSKMRVPDPRVVMGAAAGALTWWQLTSDNRRQAQR